MKVITPGHKYELGNFENRDQPGQVLQFIQKEPTTVGSGGVAGSAFLTVADGTTNEEVLEMLIDRMNFLKKKLPSRETACAITKLEEALHWLQGRTKDRQTRGVEGTPHS